MYVCMYVCMQVARDPAARPELEAVVADLEEMEAALWPGLVVPPTPQAAPVASGAAHAGGAPASSAPPPAPPVPLPAPAAPELRALTMEPAGLTLTLRLFNCPHAGTTALLLNHNDAVLLEDIPIVAGALFRDRTIAGLPYNVLHEFASTCKALGVVATPYSPTLHVRLAPPSKPVYLGFRDAAHGAEMHVHNPCPDGWPAASHLEVQYTLDPGVGEVQDPVMVPIPAGAPTELVRAVHANTLWHARSRTVFDLPAGPCFSSWSPWALHAEPGVAEVVAHPAGGQFMVRFAGGAAPPFAWPPVTSVEVECSTGVVVRAAAGAPHCVFEGLPEDVVLQFRVRVWNDGGVGPWSPWTEPKRHTGSWVS
jgi:hypothetical protein